MVGFNSVQNNCSYQYSSGGEYDLMPLVSYSDGGYVQSGGEYYFIVGPAQSEDTPAADKKVKVGYHRQGDIMDNKEFIIPPLEPPAKQRLVQSMSHIRKEIKTGDTAQSFDTDQFILEKATRMTRERFEFLNPEEVKLVMRCLYQNTPDKEFIVGHHHDDPSRDIVLACGFNGGGFQMGPMISRLCVRLLMKDILTPEEIMKLIAVEEEQSNNDFRIENIDMERLLADMETKFSPSRESLNNFK